MTVQFLQPNTVNIVNCLVINFQIHDFEGQPNGPQVFIFIFPRGFFGFSWESNSVLFFIPN